MSIIVCRPKSLPLDKFAAAERRALEINPDNASERRTVARSPIGRRGGPRRIAVVIARKWPKKGVQIERLVHGQSVRLRCDPEFSST